MLTLRNHRKQIPYMNYFSSSSFFFLSPLLFCIHLHPFRFIMYVALLCMRIKKKNYFFSFLLFCTLRMVLCVFFVVPSIFIVFISVQGQSKEQLYVAGTKTRSYRMTHDVRNKTNTCMPTNMYVKYMKTSRKTRKGEKHYAFCSIISFAFRRFAKMTRLTGVSVFFFNLVSFSLMR